METALHVNGQDRPPALRVEAAEGRRLVLRQGGTPVLFAVQRASHRGVHYARTDAYTSPVPSPRATTARALREASPTQEDWYERWAHHTAQALRDAANGPLHAGSWQLTSGMPPWSVDTHWDDFLSYDPPRGHLTWFGYGDPDEEARDVLPLRTLSPTGSARVRAYRRQLHEGVLPPAVLWWISGLNTLVVLDGHDRITAALAEGARPDVLVLSRASPEGWAEWAAGPRVTAYEHRMRVLEQQRAAGDPLAAHRMSVESRRLATDLRDLTASPELTLAWPLDGGPRVWQQLASSHVPNWQPDDRD
ncbi:hypothetical protein ACQB60_23180 [Actinomycetota bacterium Odt1-20B]